MLFRSSPIQLGGVNVVTVVDEEPLRFLSRDYLPELLKTLVRGGMGGDVEVGEILRVPLSMVTKTYRTRKLARISHDRYSKKPLLLA